MTFDDDSPLLCTIAVGAWQMMTMMNTAMILLDSDDDDDVHSVDYRRLPRSQRRSFRHKRAKECIVEDYIGPKPLFNGREFQNMLRVSRSRFERILQALAGSHHFYRSEAKDAFGRVGASVEAKVMIALKSLAFGVAPEAFRDYFSMSSTFAKTCFNMFVHNIPLLYKDEYLRGPSKDDIRRILKLHYVKHNINGMVASMDCMHVNWKNCPKGFQSAFKGKEDKPSIALEAAADYNLWFWHVSFGYPGALNDLNILQMSPLLDMMTDGTFESLETSFVPFQVGSENFWKLFFLVDGIYPNYSRFVKTYSIPMFLEQIIYAAWQESSRKDIERAFGVLQGSFQIVARPMHAKTHARISEIVLSTLILHNMRVEEYVSGQERYKPDDALHEDDSDDSRLDIPDTPKSLPQKVKGLMEVVSEDERSQIGRDCYLTWREKFQKRWKSLTCTEEHKRLQLALMRHIFEKHQEYKKS
jgi:hypothetical protein